ncbi:MAG: polysaccharide biosynthesis/export family protein [Candidatus Hatepunaea meridiana]|nr:polysaccharide biosynthesis/export family protein [Candidatus Hatepunaea meridiana]
MVIYKQCKVLVVSVLIFCFLWYVTSHTTLIAAPQSASLNNLAKIRCNLYTEGSEDARIRLAFDFQNYSEKLILKEDINKDKETESGFLRQFIITLEKERDKDIFRGVQIKYSNAGGKIKLKVGFNQISLLVKRDFELKASSFNYIKNKKVAFIDIPYSKRSQEEIPKQKSDNRKDNNPDKTNLLQRIEPKERSGHYILGPSDILGITIYLSWMNDAQPAKIEEIPITSDGQIFLPFIGFMYAADLTCEALAYKITEELKESYLNPYVTVKVVEQRSRTVTIIGKDFNGVFPIMQNERLYHLIVRNSNKGQFLKNYRRFQITRLDGSRFEVDLSKYISKGDSLNNPVLAVGDQIFIQTDKIQVKIFGAVNRPGVYSLDYPATLTTGIAVAGGFANNAKVNKITITHLDSSEPNVYNLERYIKEGDISVNPELQDGDMIYIPDRFVITWGIARDVLMSIHMVLTSYVLIISLRD